MDVNFRDRAKPEHLAGGKPSKQSGQPRELSHVKGHTMQTWLYAIAACATRASLHDLRIVDLLIICSINVKRLTVNH